MTVEVAVAGATTAPALSLDERPFTAVAHNNKFGKPYPPEAYKQ